MLIVAEGTIYAGSSGREAVSRALPNKMLVRLPRLDKAEILRSNPLL
jgi:hypothetical protein